MNCPQRDVFTPYGKMTLVLVLDDKDHPRIILDGSSDGTYITVDSERIGFSLTLDDYGIDGFEISRTQRDPVYARRIKVSTKSSFRLTGPEEKEICETLRAFVNEWVKDNEDIFADAHREAITKEIRLMQDDLDEKIDAVNVLSANIGEAVKRRAAIGEQACNTA